MSDFKTCLEGTTAVLSIDEAAGKFTLTSSTDISSKKTVQATHDLCPCPQESPIAEPLAPLEKSCTLADFKSWYAFRCFHPAQAKYLMDHAKEMKVRISSSEKGYQVSVQIPQEECSKYGGVVVKSEVSEAPVPLPPKTGPAETQEPEKLLRATATQTTATPTVICTFTIPECLCGKLPEVAKVPEAEIPSPRPTIPSEPTSPEPVSESKPKAPSPRAPLIAVYNDFDDKILLLENCEWAPLDSDVAIPPVPFDVAKRSESSHLNKLMKAYEKNPQPETCSEIQSLVTGMLGPIMKGTEKDRPLTGLDLVNGEGKKLARLKVSEENPEALKILKENMKNYEIRGTRLESIGGSNASAILSPSKTEAVALSVAMDQAGTATTDLPEEVIGVGNSAIEAKGGGWGCTLVSKSFSN